MGNRATTTSLTSRGADIKSARAVPKILTPNLGDAQTFLTALDPDPEAVFRFRVLPEKGAESPIAPRVLPGSLAQHAKALTGFNQQKAGIYVMINASTGNTAKSVTRVRSYFVDKDGSPLHEFMDAPHPPDIIIETSEGKYHGYWLTADAPLEKFTERQLALAEHFNGDHRVADLPRIMRVPGFWHQKYGVPFLSRFVKLGDKVFK